MICKNDKTYLITNVKGYNITNNNIIYGDLDSSTISNNLLKHKLKYEVNNNNNNNNNNNSNNNNNNNNNNKSIAKTKNKPPNVCFFCAHLGLETEETAYNHL